MGPFFLRGNFRAWSWDFRDDKTSCDLGIFESRRGVESPPSRRLCHGAFGLFCGVLGGDAGGDEGSF